MMTLDEIYEFDLNGYIIYRNMLAPEEVEDINAILQSVNGAVGDGKFSFFELDKCFVELMARPRTIAILKVLLGDWLRFDHAFGIHMTKASLIAENLHAGPLQNQRAFWYQWVAGQGMHNGLVKVIYTLSDVNPGDGGFICVPGSHKANLRYRPSHNSHIVVNPELRKGDMLVFTEALVHGSRKWMADHTRRALIYSYAPGYLCWKNYEMISPYLALATNDLQRDLLRPPYVGDYNEHEAKLTGYWAKGRRAEIRLNNAASLSEGLLTTNTANPSTAEYIAASNKLLT